MNNEEISSPDENRQNSLVWAYFSNKQESELLKSTITKEVIKKLTEDFKEIYLDTNEVTFSETERNGDTCFIIKGFKAAENAVSRIISKYRSLKGVNVNTLDFDDSSNYVTSFQIVFTEEGINDFLGMDEYVEVEENYTECSESVSDVKKEALETLLSYAGSGF